MMTAAPRRLSVDGEYGLPVDKEVAIRVRVFIDGEECRYVIAYDCDEGWAECHALDDHGRVVHMKGEYATRRHYGDVKAILRP
jgi:hypothetical protein